MQTCTAWIFFVPFIYSTCLFFRIFHFPLSFYSIILRRKSLESDRAICASKILSRATRYGWEKFKKGEGKNNERAVRPHVSHLETRTRWNHSWAEIRSVARTARFKFDTSMPKIQRRYLLLFPQSPRILIFRRGAATMHPFLYITRSIAHLSSRVSSFANFYSTCWEKIIIRNDPIR